jgi:hypothetical protein
MLKPYMLQHHHLTSSDPNPSSAGSPPSSAAHEEPLRRQVLEWLDKAEASRTSTVDFATTLGTMGMGIDVGVGADGRAYNDSSSDEAEAGEEGEEGEEKFSSSTSGLARPPITQRHSYPQGQGQGHDQTQTRAEALQGKIQEARASRSRSPRINRNSVMAPVPFLAHVSLRGSSIGMSALNLNQSRHSASSGGDSHSFGAGAGAGTGGAASSSHGMHGISPVDIGVARHDYFMSGDAFEAQRASQLGLRRIEIDRGLSEEPKLLRKGLIVPDEVDKLFEIFYEKLNVSGIFWLF